MANYPSGVYAITTPSGRRYIGSAVNFGSRWSVHKHHFKRRTHPNPILQSAWDKYGRSLNFSPIIFCSRTDVVCYDQLAIDALDPEMNVLRVAGSSIGYKHTEETKSKFHLRRKTPMTAELLAKRSATMKGRKISAEHKAKVQAAKIGRPRSQICKENLRKAMLGKKRGPCSEETKRKISEAQKGKKRKPISAEHAKRLHDGCRSYHQRRRDERATKD